MINYMENLETVVSKELKQEKNHFIQKIYPLSPIDISRKNVKRKSRFKDRIPLCNWTMPKQPEGYIRAVKYDLL
jgi:hypothetical protein